MEELMDGRMQINGFLKHLGGRPVFNSEKGLLKEGKKKKEEGHHFWTPASA